mgnify:CR=1 FL=1
MRVVAKIIGFALIAAAIGFALQAAIGFVRGFTDGSAREAFGPLGLAMPLAMIGGLLLRFARQAPRRSSPRKF